MRNVTKSKKTIAVITISPIKYQAWCRKQSDPSFKVTQPGEKAEDHNSIYIRVTPDNPSRIKGLEIEDCVDLTGYMNFWIELFTKMNRSTEYVETRAISVDERVYDTTAREIPAMGEGRKLLNSGTLHDGDDLS